MKESKQPEKDTNMDHCGYPTVRRNCLPSDGKFSPSSQDEASRTTDHSLREQPERKDRNDDLPGCSRPRDDEDATPAPRNFEDTEETRLPFFEPFYLNFDFKFDLY